MTLDGPGGWEQTLQVLEDSNVWTLNERELTAVRGSRGPRVGETGGNRWETGVYCGCRWRRTGGNLYLDMKSATESEVSGIRGGTATTGEKEQRVFRIAQGNQTADDSREGIPVEGTLGEGWRKLSWIWLTVGTVC